MMRQNQTTGTSRCSIFIDVEARAGLGRGVFFCPAQDIRAEDVNLMAKHGRGVVGAVLSAERAFALQIPPVAGQRIRPQMPIYATSVEAADCADTGISAAERALTLRQLGAASPCASRVNTPGHIIPAIARASGGAEASLPDAAFHYRRDRECDVLAWCDVLSDAGDVASAAECLALADQLPAQSVLWYRSEDRVDVMAPEAAILNIAAE